MQRRNFLSAGSLGFLGLNLAGLLRAKPSGKAQSCILLWLEGGPSQMDTWDPKPTSSFQPAEPSEIHRCWSWQSGKVIRTSLSAGPAPPSPCFPWQAAQVAYTSRPSE